MTDLEERRNAWAAEPGRPASWRSEGRRPLAAVLGVTAALSVLGGWQLWAPRGDLGPGPVRAADVTSPAEGSISTVGNGFSTSGPPPPLTTPTSMADAACPAVPSALLSADIDSDGCPDALRYDGGLLESGPVRWRVGRQGDQVAVGDWWCTGRRTLAVLRPGEGTVFAFTGWAEADDELSVPASGSVAGGQAVRAADLDGDGCHELVVERRALPPELVILPEPEGRYWQERP